LKTRLIATVFLFALLITGQVARADSDFEAAEILFTQAVLAYDDGNFGEATRTLLKAHALDPGHVNVIYYLGLSYNAQGDFAEAERYLRQGAQLQPKNVDIHYELGIALYGQNRYDDALKEFLAVLAANPQRDHAGYYAGLCYYQKRDYENAATYFRRNVASDSKTHQLNQYYLGLALHELGRNAEAIEELTEAVRIAPASPLVAGTQQLLTAIREEAGGKRLRLEATLNVQYDTNPSYRRKPEASVGNLLNARVDYTIYKAGPWESTLNYSLVQTLNYQNHNGDINDNIIGANIYYKGFIAGMPTISGLQLNNDVLLFGGDLFLQRPTATLTFTAQENASNYTTVLFRPQYKDFMLKGEAEKRRANNEMLGFIHYMRFGAAQHVFNFGYQFDRENARSDQWTYNGYKAIAGFLINLPWQVRWNTNVEYHARFYAARDFDFGKVRIDHEPTVLTALSKDITPNMTATLQYFYDHNISTVTEFSVRREVFAAGLTWRY
jgi:tetratricopeptide (TPR) repeat protein